MRPCITSELPLAIVALRVLPQIHPHPGHTVENNLLVAGGCQSGSLCKLGGFVEAFCGAGHGCSLAVPGTEKKRPLLLGENHSYPMPSAPHDFAAPLENFRPNEEGETVRYTYRAFDFEGRPGFRHVTNDAIDSSRGAEHNRPPFNGAKPRASALLAHQSSVYSMR